MKEVKTRVPATEQITKTHHIRIFTVDSSGYWKNLTEVFPATSKAMQWLRKNGEDGQRYEIVRLCKSVKVNVRKVRKLT